MLEKHLYTRTYTAQRTYRRNEGRTGVVLVSRCGYLSSPFLSLYYLQTTSTYSLESGDLAV